MDIRDKFINEGIPFDILDPEMIELLDVLNFQLGLKTKYCCYGHLPNEDTYILFDDNIKDENIVKLLIAIDSNVGTSGVKKVELHKWARIMYEPFFKKPWNPKLNWMFKIKYINCESRKQRLDDVTNAIKELDIKSLIE